MDGICGTSSRRNALREHALNTRLGENVRDKARAQSELKTHKHPLLNLLNSSRASTISCTSRLVQARFPCCRILCAMSEPPSSCTIALQEPAPSWTRCWKSEGELDMARMRFQTWQALRLSNVSR